MNIVVTGGAGFVGSHLVESLLAEGHAVLVLDTYATARRDSLPEEFAALRVHQASVADADAVAAAFAEAAPELVVHCAASYKDPDDWAEDVRTNTLGTATVVKESLRANVRRLIYFQTALCYGNRPRERPVPLSHPLAPESSYAISKTAGELYIAHSGLEFVSFRLANVYGPRNVSGPVPTFYKRLVEGLPCFAVDTRRDFVFVDDLIDVVMRAVRGEGGSGYYHVSSGSDDAIVELYRAVAEAMGVDRPAEERERGPDDAPSILLDPSRTQADFGWRATTPLREGIRRTVDWYRRFGVEETYTHLRMKA